MDKKEKKLEINGLLLFDKPLGFSSNQALSKIKWIFSAKKAGHTGTLDPLATGLLPICFGEATKFSSHLLNSEKTYEASIKLGWKSSTGDAEGKLIKSKTNSFTLENLQDVLDSFIGISYQTPPMFSALKHKGKPLYKFAREGVKVKIQERKINVSKLILLKKEKNMIKIEVTCSKGTYIRTLGENIAEKLGTNGYLIDLRRTKIGDLSVQNAFALDKIENLTPTERKACLRPTETLVKRYPEIILSDTQVKHIKNGQSVKLLSKIDAQIYALFTESKVFFGIGQIDNDYLLKAVRLISTNIN